MAQMFDIRKVTIGPKNLEAIVEVAPSAPLMTSDDAEGTSLVLELIPELADHICLGDASSHFGGVIENTELTHLLEHVTVELLARTDLAGDISSGRTIEVGDRLYEITFACPDDVLVAAALSSAVWILQWAYSGGGDPQPDVDAIASGLVGLVESLDGGDADQGEEAEEELEYSDEAEEEAYFDSESAEAADLAEEDPEAFEELEDAEDFEDQDSEEELAEDPDAEADQDDEPSQDDPRSGSWPENVPRPRFVR